MITSLDPRTGPSAFLGLGHGDAMVTRTAALLSPARERS